MSLCEYSRICSYFSNNGVCRAAPRNRRKRCEQFINYKDNGQGKIQSELLRLYGQGEKRDATPAEIRMVIQKSRRS